MYGLMLEILRNVFAYLYDCTSWLSLTISNDGLIVYDTVGYSQYYEQLFYSKSSSFFGATVNSIISFFKIQNFFIMPP